VIWNCRPIACVTLSSIHGRAVPVESQEKDDEHRDQHCGHTHESRGDFSDCPALRHDDFIAFPFVVRTTNRVMCLCPQRVPARRFLFAIANPNEHCRVCVDLI
jgi:hypothetical protein